MKRFLVLVLFLCSLAVVYAQDVVSFEYDFEVQMSDRFTIYIGEVSGDISSGTVAENVLYIVDNLTGMRVFYDKYTGNVSVEDITFSEDSSQSDQFHQKWNIKVARDFMSDIEYSLLLPLVPEAQTMMDH